MNSKVSQLSEELTPSGTDELYTISEDGSKRISFDTIFSAFGIQDAPSDGTIYGRQDADWTQLPSELTNGVSGWADYADSTYTSGSPFALAANTDTILPNDGLNGPKTYEPAGIQFYNTSTQKITGQTGQARDLTIELTAVPTSGSATYLEIWIDIGGSVGELYRRIITFPKGQGVARPITLTTALYTLDTWENNGGTVYVRANGTVNIYGIRYVIFQQHPIGGNRTLEQINEITGTSHVVTAGDLGVTLWTTNASPVTITLPQDTTENLAGGFNGTIIQGGTGTVTVQVEGADQLISSGSLVSSNGQGAELKYKKKQSGIWWLGGDRA